MIFVLTFLFLLGSTMIWLFGGEIKKVNHFFANSEKTEGLIVGWIPARERTILRDDSGEITGYDIKSVGFLAKIEYVTKAGEEYPVTSKKVISREKSTATIHYRKNFPDDVAIDEFYHTGSKKVLGFASGILINLGAFIGAMTLVFDN